MDKNTDLRTITTELEHGDAHQLPGLLAGKFEEDRIATLKQIVAINEQDRQKNSNMPELELSVTSGFAGYNGLDLMLDHHNWHDFWNNGPTIYSDRLNVPALTHSNPADKVPANTRGVDTRSLTNDLEHLNARAVTSMLNGLREEERIRVFQQVGAINQADLKAGRTKMNLDISITPNKCGQDSIDVRAVGPGTSSEFMGGNMLYSDQLDLQTDKRTTYTY